jgi:hypothetical protein
MSNMPAVPFDTLGRAQALVRQLLASGHTHATLAEALGDRVTARTIYRWAKGEHAPQRASDLVALERLTAAAETPKSA